MSTPALRARVVLTLLATAAAGACIDFQAELDDCVKAGRCEGPGALPQDAGGTQDGGSSGGEDGGSSDAGGEIDGGGDAGSTDAGFNDAGGSDAGSEDAGQDAGATDAGCTPGPLSQRCTTATCTAFTVDGGKELATVFGFSPTDVWIGGDSRLLHWDGCDFEEVDVGAAYINRIWGSDPSDVWMVGWIGTAEPYQAVIRRWDGSALLNHDFGAGSGALMSVSGSSGTDVWMVGFTDQFITPLIAKFDGSGPTKLTQFESPPNHQTVSLYDVASTAPGEFLTVGNVGSVIRHESDGTWTGYSEIGQHHAVYANGANDAWIAGLNGRFYRFLDGGFTAVDAGAVTYWDLDGTSPNDVWAAGTNATIGHFDGGSWSFTKLPGVAANYGVWAGPTEIWFVNQKGEVIVRKR